MPDFIFGSVLVPNVIADSLEHAKDFEMSDIFVFTEKYSTSVRIHESPDFYLTFI